MSRRRNSYLFRLPLILFLCCCLQALVQAQTSSGRLKNEDCSAAKVKYAEGVKLLNYNERQAAFQKAVDLCPSYAEAHVNLADALEHMGLSKKKNDQKSLIEANKLLDEAIRNYSKAIDLNHNMVAPKIGLGDVYMAQGRYPLAVESYENALKSQPSAQGVKERLNEAKRLADSDSKDKKTVKEASDITKEVKSSNLEGMYKVMGIENFTVADTARQSFNNIQFEGWSSAIKLGDPINQLDEIGKALKSNDMISYKFVIEGHANTVGASEENMVLSNSRAVAVKDYLVKNFNVDPNRIITQGFGYTRPKFSPATDARNRRVEVVFVK